MISLQEPISAKRRIRAVIIDADTKARKVARSLIDRDGAFEVIREVEQRSEAEAVIRVEQPDVLFMDAMVPGANGVDFIGNLAGEYSPALVFVAERPEHAMRAFEINAIDYLLKPYDDHRFAMALERAKRHVRCRQADAMNTQMTELLGGVRHQAQETIELRLKQAATGNRILVKSRGDIFFVRVEDVMWIGAQGDYVQFHLHGASGSCMMREKMGQLEARLDPARFIRIHRSTIVNIDRLRKLTPSFSGEYAAELTDGTKLRVSRSYHEKISSLLKSAERPAR